MILTLLDLIPDMSYHWENVDEFPLDGLTVSKNSSNWMWNYGKTNLFCRLIIKSTDDACLGEGPRLIPRLSLDSHLRCYPSDCRLLLRVCT